MLIYYALFDSRLRYAILGWGTASEHDLAKVRVLQNRAVRFITFASFRSPIAPLYSKLKIMPLQNQYFFQKAMFMHSLHYQNLPFALSVYCHQPKHRYSTRYSTSFNYVLPRVSTNRGQGSIKFAGPKAWADIPKHLKEVAFKKPFSKKLKKHILTQIHVDPPPPKAHSIRNGLLYDELKIIFQADDDQSEFFGFDQSESSNSEITLLNKNDNTIHEFYHSSNERKNNLNLLDIFENDSEDSNEFFGFTDEEIKSTDLNLMFLNDSTDTEFIGF